MHRTWLMTGSEAAAVCLKDPAAPPSESTLCGWTGSCRAAPKLPCACLVGTQTAGACGRGPGLSLALGSHAFPLLSWYCLSWADMSLHPRVRSLHGSQEASSDVGDSRLSRVPPLHVGISLGQDWFMYFLLLAS